MSVVVPAYNAATTLRATLASIASQTLLPLEVLVVDDGSSDDTAAVARGMAGHLPALQVISIPHSGVSAARNAGIERARGDLVAPVDADDLLHATYIEKMTRAFERDPACGLAYCYLRRIDLDGRVAGNGTAVPVAGNGLHRLLALNYAPNGSVVAFRRRALVAAGGYDPAQRQSEDYLMLLIMAQRHPVAVVAEHLVGYRNVPGSLGKRFVPGDTDRRALAHRLPAVCPGAPRRFVGWAQARGYYKMAPRLLRTPDLTLARKLPAIGFYLARAAMADPLGTLVLTSAAGWRLLARRTGGRAVVAASWAVGQPFLAMDPTRLDPRPLPWLTRRRLAIAGKADEAAPPNWTLAQAEGKAGAS
jgi:hypothetical protein